MLSEYKTNKLIEIFIDVDDFCKSLSDFLKDKPYEAPSFCGRMRDSEVITILMFYQYSGYKCFQYYYTEMVEKDLKTYFPQQVSYKRFLSIMSRCDSNTHSWGFRWIFIFWG